jgi:hypothetical protein
LVVLLHAGWQASLVDRVTPERADERQRRLLAESMGAVPPSDGMLRLQVAHPVLAGGIQFQLPLSLVQEAAAIAEAAGLELLRLRLAPAAVLELLAARYASLVHGQDLLVADFQSVLLIECQDGRWSRVRFASNRPGELANDLGRHLRERSRPDAPLVLAGDPPVVELVRRLQPEIGLGLPPFQQANPSLDAALFA